MQKGTEEKGTACTLEKPDLNLVHAFGAPHAKCIGEETPRRKGCRKGRVPSHKGCAERVQNGGSTAERGVHKGCTKGCTKGCKNPPSSKRRGYVENLGKWTISGLTENRPPKGAETCVDWPRTIFQPHKVMRLGPHAKRALERGGSCLHLLAVHPIILLKTNRCHYDAKNNQLCPIMATQITNYIVGYDVHRFPTT